MFAVFLLATALSVTNAPTATAVEAMPPQMVAVWNQARRESRRTADLLARGAVDADEAQRRRAAIRRAFARVCRSKGLPEAEIVRWQSQLPIR